MKKREISDVEKIMQEQAAAAVMQENADSGSLLAAIGRDKALKEKIAAQHEQAHGHIHANQKQVLNRLARIEGHIHAVRRMVEEGRDCPEVLIQIAAVRKALDNTAKVILKDHLEHCVLHAVAEGNGSKSLEEFELAIDRYLK